jgi:hypothetical protein
VVAYEAIRTKGTIVNHGTKFQRTIGIIALAHHALAVVPSKLTPKRKALGKIAWQPGSNYLFLCLPEVIRNKAIFDHPGYGVENNITGIGI